MCHGTLSALNPVLVTRELKYSIKFYKKTLFRVGSVSFGGTWCRSLSKLSFKHESQALHHRYLYLYATLSGSSHHKHRLTMQCKHMLFSSQIYPSTWLSRNHSSHIRLWSKTRTKSETPGVEALARAWLLLLTMLSIVVVLRVLRQLNPQNDSGSGEGDQLGFSVPL